MKNWSIDKAADTYGIKNWGNGYFNIDQDGYVVITPFGKKNETAVRLLNIINDIEKLGLKMPIILRIENLLDSQIQLLHDSFNSAIQETGYTGRYQWVYPVKVNQHKQVIDAITNFGQTLGHGLEVGSKAELIAAISIVKDSNVKIVCNGYKDRDFINLALYACKIGLFCVLVIEMPSELDLIIEQSKRLQVRPRLGVRSKLTVSAPGLLAKTNGDTSVFGLNMSQIVDVIETLKKQDMLDCLLLLHYHIGTQISDIYHVRAGTHEACRIYEGLVKEGAKMGYLDLGGGLAVDYEGTSSNDKNSCNYTVAEYCYDIVETILFTLDAANIPHPTIITESGRAVVAYHSVLLFNILDVSSFVPHPIPTDLATDCHEELKNLLECYHMIAPKKVQECYNDAIFYRDQVRQLFKHGQISLRDRAIAEDIFLHIIIKIVKASKKLRHVPEDIQKTDIILSDIYYGNFSLFQSLPDIWAINQLFPIMPIHRLTEIPTRPAVLADITCDSDGKITAFVGENKVQNTLSLHSIKENETYYLGAFLVGAYQEILGDFHNLLGNTNCVTIRINKNGSHTIVDKTTGIQVKDVLSSVGFPVENLRQNIHKLTTKSTQDKLITPQEQQEIIDVFDKNLHGYTYLETKR